MRALVTGASGFVGRHLGDALAVEGVEVVGSGRKFVSGIERREALASFVAADMRDGGAVRDAVREAGPGVVFHLAAQSSVALSWEAPADTIHANVMATVNLLEAVRRECPEATVLLVGSGESYGAVAAESLPVGEDEELCPANPYALSKTVSERIGRWHAEVHGMRVAVTRSFNHAGPGQAPSYVVSSLARQAAEAEARGEETVKIVHGNPEVSRDFCDVRDVVRAYQLAAAVAADADGVRVYNVCSGRAAGVPEILDALAAELGRPVEGHTDPELVRTGEVMEIRGSHERLTADTGWEPSIPFEQTVGDTLAWWRRRVAAEAPA